MKNPASQTPNSVFADGRIRRGGLYAFFNPRAIIAFVFFTAAASLAAFAITPSGLDATPGSKPSLTQPSSSTSTTAASFQTFSSPLNNTSSSNQLPAGVPLPAGAQIGNPLNGQTEPLSSGVAARFPGLKGMPLRSKMASGAKSPGTPALSNQQPAALTPNAASMPAASSVANASWSIVTSPNTGAATTTFAAVTCVSQSDCWAVGRSAIGGTNTDTTLMHWGGGSWQLVPAPSVEQVANGLVSIACVSSSSCWAVGYTINIHTVQVQTLTLHWDGVSWQIVSSPNVGNGFNALYGVACTSDSDCWAVGFENGGNVAKTLIERWDGTSWTVRNSPNVGTEHNVLNGVTCVSASNCVAVGYTGVAGAKSGLVAQWDGTAWTASALPNQPLSQEDTLYSVTCNSTSHCWAVGNSYNGTEHQTLVEQWNGTSWTSAVAPNGGVDNYLLSVTCNSTSDCWATGYSNNSQADPQLVDQALFLHWNGSAWVLSATVPDTGNATDLKGVACASGSDCWAVGTILPASRNPTAEPLLEHWDGTSWTSVAVPSFPLIDGNFLDAVSCAGASDCWAAGFYFSGTVARSLTIHWDGTSWKITDSPNTSMSRSNYLVDITCVSSSDCWAVGSSSDNLGLQDQALAIHWNGTAWSVVNPAPMDTSQQLETDFQAVACAASADCWAVGYQVIQDANQGFNPDQALIEHWNGTVWVPIATPPQQNVPTLNSILFGVTCASTSDCTAVGIQWSYFPTGNGIYQTLIDHWDGTAWSVVASPNTASNTDNILYGVRCVSTTDCWAVGSFNNYSQALVEQWDGTSWSIVAVPQATSILNTVTCLSASDCWAAGPYYTPNPPAQTMLMHWDGTAWTKASSPNTSAKESNTLSGIACVSSSNCWAVGDSWGGGRGTSTLVLRYVPSPSLTSIVSRKTHGSAGTFDVNLPLAGNPGIECRSGGANGDYTMIFTFANPLTSVGGASVTSGTGSVVTNYIDSTDAHNYIVNVTGVANAQVIKVSLTNVTDSAGDFSSAVPISMGVLVGDVNANKVVSNTDVASVKAQVTAPVTSSNFRNDVNANGVISNTDVSLVKAQVGTSLP